MVSFARCLALALAACALGAAGAAADPGKSPQPGVPGGTATPGKAGPAAAPATPAGKVPKGYTVVSSGFFNANTGTQTRGTVACPAGLVPFGGGVYISGSSLNVNANSTFPSGAGWVADVNNVSGAVATFQVWAACATAPKKYQVVAAGPFTSPANGQSAGAVSCPAKTVVLGGGSLSASGSVAVNINSTFPTATGWRTDQNTNTSTASTFTVYAICAKAPKGYVLLQGGAVSNPANSQTRAAIGCPVRTVPLSGGAFSSSTSAAVDLNTTNPVSGGWQVYENNTALINGVTISALVICAGK